MANFKAGDKVQIQCEIGPGAFPTEFLVTFETTQGPISGFVKKGNIIRDDKSGVGYITGEIVSVTPQIITVLVEGSFFTTTGIATLKRDWADKHVQVAQAA